MTVLLQVCFKISYDYCQHDSKQRLSFCWCSVMLFLSFYKLTLKIENLQNEAIHNAKLQRMKSRNILETPIMRLLRH